MRNIAIRWVRATAGLAVLALALSASPAGSHEVVHRFSANHSGKVRAFGVGEQEFTLGPFSISCRKARTESTASTIFPSPTIYVQVDFSACATAATTLGKSKVPAGKAGFRTVFDIEYHASGYAEIGAGSKSNHELTDVGPIEISPGDGSECTLALPPQTVPTDESQKPYAEYEAASYTDEQVPTENLKKFPTGVQDKLLVKSVFSKLAYVLSEGECKELHGGEQRGATYTGALVAELPNAQLGWE